jgi:DNA-binding transcriptional regulator WhiA
MKYTEELIQKVLEDYNSGKNKSQLEKEYNISRSTIRYWIDNKDSIFIPKTTDKTLDVIIQEIKNNKETYNYILGLYLGDGCISPHKMSYKLRITQDNKYPKSIIDIKNILNSFFPNNTFTCNPKGCTVIGIYDKNLPLYFPQHAPGKKHDRKIKLADYQRDNLDYENLMKGLWVSDGSYYLAQKKYECYNFTNKSTDIISLFEECLNSFNIAYRKRMKKNGVWILEITKKSEVSKMKDLIGVKC